MAGRIAKVSIFAVILALIVYILSRRVTAVDPFDEE